MIVSGEKDSNNSDGAGNRQEAETDSLEQISERLKAAESEVNRNKDSDIESHSGLAQAYKMGIELVVGVGVGLLIGLAIDGFLGTKPYLMIVFIFLGFAAGLRNIMREAQILQADLQEETEQDKRPHNDTVDKTQD